MSMRSLVVDRIEDDVAVVESPDGASYTLSADLLPEGAKEGAWLRMNLELDPEGTQAASERVSALRATLVVEDDGEDFAL
jgi:hypothetical protein